MTITSAEYTPPYVQLNLPQALTEAEASALTLANSSRRPSEVFDAALTDMRKFVIDKVSKDIAASNMVDQVLLRGMVAEAWQLFLPTFTRTTVPVIAESFISSFRDVNEHNVPAQLIYNLAEEHARRMGQYFNDTSSEAITQGFNQMVNKQVPPKLAAQRIIEAFGLSPRQMNGVVSGVELQPKKTSSAIPVNVKRKVQDYIAKSFMKRMTVFREQEEHNLGQQADQVAWMWLKRHNKLPSNTKKRWLTARDEKVCKQCGPMQGKKVGLDEQFELPGGMKLYVPGAHVNCRCTVELTSNPLTVVKRFEWIGKAEKFDAKKHPRGKSGKFTRLFTGKIAFTGTRKGMTEKQVAQVHKELAGASEMLNGVAVGADTQAMKLAEEHGMKISKFPAGKDPLRRNRTMVDGADRVIAAPKGFKEELRSGTWATIRYARKQKKTVIIVWPDGAVTREIPEISKADGFDPVEHPRGTSGRFVRRAPQNQPEVAEREELPELTAMRDRLAAERLAELEAIEETPSLTSKEITTAEPTSLTSQPIAASKLTSETIGSGSLTSAPIADLTTEGQLTSSPELTSTRSLTGAQALTRTTADLSQRQLQLFGRDFSGLLERIAAMHSVRYKHDLMEEPLPGTDYFVDEKGRSNTVFGMVDPQSLVEYDGVITLKKGDYLYTWGDAGQGDMYIMTGTGRRLHQKHDEMISRAADNVVGSDGHVTIWAQHPSYGNIKATLSQHEVRGVASSIAHDNPDAVVQTFWEDEEGYQINDNPEDDPIMLTAEQVGEQLNIAEEDFEVTVVMLNQGYTTPGHPVDYQVGTQYLDEAWSAPGKYKIIDSHREDIDVWDEGEGDNSRAYTVPVRIIEAEPIEDEMPTQIREVTRAEADAMRRGRYRRKHGRDPGFMRPPFED